MHDNSEFLKLFNNFYNFHFQRVLFIFQDELETGMEELRQEAKAVGFVFPASPPEENVMGPHTSKNHLSYQALPHLSLPHRMDVLDGCKKISKV